MWTRARACFDFRFANEELETAFKESLDLPLLRTGTALCVCVPLSSLVIIVPSMLQESARHENTFTWQVGDPRTFYFSQIGGQFFLLLACSIIGGVRLRFAWLLRLNVEALVMAVCLTAILSSLWGGAWHVAVIFGQEPAMVWAEDTSGSEEFMVRYLTFTLTVCCLYLPIRIHVLWILHITATSGFVMMLAAAGSPAPSHVPDNLAFLVLFMIFSYQGARRNERFARERFLATHGLRKSQIQIQEQDVELSESLALARAMRSAAHVFCDIVVTLGHDGKVSGSIVALNSFFGTPMEGQLFANHVAADYQEPFAGLLKRASDTRVPQCMPVKLMVKYGRGDAQLFVVHTESKHAPWLLGIRNDEAAGAAGAPAPDAAGLADLDAAMPMVRSFDREREKDSPLSPVAPEFPQSEISFVLTTTTVQRSSLDAGTQTQAMDMHNRETREIGVATKMVWSDSAFVCMSCMKPPRLPGFVPRISAIRRRRRRSRSATANSECSSSSSEQVSRVSGESAPDWHQDLGDDFFLPSLLLLQDKMNEANADFDFESAPGEGGISESYSEIKPVCRSKARIMASV